MTISTRQKGSNSESIAMFYLESSHYQIIDKNWHLGKYGEIDIICIDKKTNELVFIEVKSRITSLEDAKELVNKNKQKQLYKLAEAYLSRYKQENLSCRFDVIAIKIDNKTSKLEHIKNAFYIKYERNNKTIY